MIYFFLLFVVVLGLRCIEPPSIAGNNLIRPKKPWYLDFGFFYTFILLATLSAIREDVGCDYYSYVNHITNIQLGRLNYMEPGFQFVVWLLSSYNENPRIVIILFGVLTCFFFLRSIWDQSSNITLSVFIFLTWGLYFMTFNTIRNYFALSVVFFAIKYLSSNKKLLFIVFCLLAALIHKSALICIPLYLVAYSIKLKKRHIPLIILFTLLLLSFRPLLRSYAFMIYSSYEDGVYDTGRVSVFNIIKAVIVIGICLYYYKDVFKDRLLRFYFNLIVFSLVLYCGVYWLPEISRIGFYMNMTVIFLIPRLLSTIQFSSGRKRLKRKKLMGYFVLLSLFIFVLLLFQFSSETTRLLPYKTWLFNGSFNNV